MTSFSDVLTTFMMLARAGKTAISPFLVMRWTIPVYVSGKKSTMFPERKRDESVTTNKKTLSKQLLPLRDVTSRPKGLMEGVCN